MVDTERSAERIIISIILISSLCKDYHKSNHIDKLAKIINSNLDYEVQKAQLLMLEELVSWDSAEYA